jgi:hypothetical protein
MFLVGFQKNEMGPILISNWYQPIWYQVGSVYNPNDDTDIDTRVQPIYHPTLIETLRFQTTNLKTMSGISNGRLMVGSMKV